PLHSSVSSCLFSSVAPCFLIGTVEYSTGEPLNQISTDFSIISISWVATPGVSICCDCRRMTFSELRQVDLVGKKILGQLKNKYPRLDAHLVYSSPSGSADIGTGPKKILEDYPSMLQENEAKKHGLRLIKERKHLEREEKDCRQIEAQLDPFLSQLIIDDSVQLELRFGELDYTLVHKLQQDPLVDRVLTPQKASIRIVLGTLGSLLLKPT
ncbi:hypothetical protein WDW86_19100, partial [Bdellovibrionota bacterium FG-2]